MLDLLKVAVPSLEKRWHGNGKNMVGLILVLTLARKVFFVSCV